MRRSIDRYIQDIVHDYAEYIINGGYKSIADYFISSSEDGTGWYDLFDDEELEPPSCEPSKKQIEEVKKYLLDNYNYLP